MTVSRFEAVLGAILGLSWSFLASFYALGPVLGGSGPVLCLSWAVLGLSWAGLGPSGAVLSLSWGCLGPSWAWGLSWDGFGAVLDLFGFYFGAQMG